MSLSTAQFLSSIPAPTRAVILNSIAQHYGITQDVALAEVTDPEAEHLLDYMTEPHRTAALALMISYGAY